MSTNSFGAVIAVLAVLGFLPGCGADNARNGLRDYAATRPLSLSAAPVEVPPGLEALAQLTALHPSLTCFQLVARNQLSSTGVVNYDLQLYLTNEAELERVVSDVLDGPVAGICAGQEKGCAFTVSTAINPGTELLSLLAWTGASPLGYSGGSLACPAPGETEPRLQFVVPSTSAEADLRQLFSLAAVPERLFRIRVGVHQGL